MIFFTAVHCKGPGDGVGDIIKRMSAHASLQPFDKQIKTSEEL